MIEKKLAEHAQVDDQALMELLNAMMPF